MKVLLHLTEYKYILADSGLIFHLKMNIRFTAADILIQCDNYSGEQYAIVREKIIDWITEERWVWVMSLLEQNSG